MQNESRETILSEARSSHVSPEGCFNRPPFAISRNHHHGRAISIPVWFVWKAGKLYLLPVEGSDTQWYKNVLQNSSIRITSQGAEAALIASPITDSAQVSSVVGNFRAKYGAGDVKKYYAKFDVAVLAEMRRAPS